MDTCRCAVCLRTNAPWVDPHQYTPGPFFDDPHAQIEGDKLCEECLSFINETYEGYEEEDFDVYTDDAGD